MSATILCYHKVGLAQEEGRRLNIEPFRLRSHVQFFAKRNRPFLLAKDLRGSWPQGTVCFTFDDAYSSTMVHAPGIFEEYGVRATFYAVPGRVGGCSDWDGEAARPLAGWEALAEAAGRGHEIGNHSQNHPHLANLSPDEQFAEIEAAHQALLEHGIKPGSFCFPYGSHDSHTLDQLSRMNYPVGLALGKRIAQPTDDRRALPRVVVAFSDALPMLLYKITLKQRLRQLSRQ